MPLVDYAPVVVVDISLEEVRRVLGVDFESCWEDGLGWVAVSPLWEDGPFTYALRHYLHSPLPGLEICLDILDANNGRVRAVKNLLNTLSIDSKEVLWYRAGYLYTH